MQVKILKTHETAIDCRTIILLNKDEIIDLDDNTANSLIRGGLGISVEEKMMPKIENKAILNSPENKVEEVEALLNQYCQLVSPKITISEKEKVKVIKKAKK